MTHLNQKGIVNQLLAIFNLPCCITPVAFRMLFRLAVFCYRPLVVGKDMDRSALIDDDSHILLVGYSETVIGCHWSIFIAG